MGLKLEKEEIIKILKKNAPFLSKKYEIFFIILFGSLAYNKRDAMSDVDIGVYLEPYSYQYPNILFDLSYEFTKLLKTDKVDLVILNEANPSLKFEIFTKGTLIHCEDELSYENAYLKALKEYFDFQYILERDYEEAKKYFSSEENK